MSVLRDRIVLHGGQGHRGGDVPAAPAGHPTGTAATPHMLPLGAVFYGADDEALYGTLHPLVTADGAVIPAHSQSAIAQPRPPSPLPAGRP